MVPWTMNLSAGPGSVSEPWKCFHGILPCHAMHRSFQSLGQPTSGPHEQGRLNAFAQVQVP